MATAITAKSGTKERVESTPRRVVPRTTVPDECDYIKLYLKEINSTPLLSYEEEIALSKRVRGGDKEALQRLIKANLRLVVKIAKQYVTQEYQLMDIVQDGNLGLIKAAEKYDHKREVRFSTYASWWIKQSIVRSLSLKKRMIRLPHRKEEKLRKIKKTWNVLYQQQKRITTSSEIAAFLGFREGEVDEILAVSNQVVSFDNTLLTDDFPLVNLLEDNSYAPDTLVLDKKLKEETLRSLDTLVPKERTVIIKRFGFSDEEKHTLKDMGDSFGISAETVRQIELKAMKKIREQFGYMAEYLG